MSDQSNWCRVAGHPFSCRCEYEKRDPEWVVRWKRTGKRFDEWNRIDHAARAAAEARAAA